MYLQIEEGVLKAWGDYPIPNWNKQVDIDYKDYTKNPDKYIFNGETIVLNPNYEAEQEAKEQARIQELSMTRSDFFDGTIKAFGVGENELLAAIQAILVNMAITDIDKKIALNNYQNALNFYRKHPLFTMLSGVKIPISETASILVTSEQWDKFFDETDKGNEEAYKALLPVIENKETENVKKDNSNNSEVVKDDI